MTRALALPGPVPPPLRATALHSAAFLALDVGDYAVAHRWTAERLALLRTLDDRLGIARALRSLGVTALYQGDGAQALALSEESLALHRTLDDALGEAGALNNLGYIALAAGDTAQAQALCSASLAGFVTAGKRWGQASALGNLGTAALLTGDLPAARRYYQQQLALGQGLAQTDIIAHAMTGLAAVEGAAGDWMAAAAGCGTVATLLRAKGLGFALVEQRLYEQTIQAARAALLPGHFARAWATGSTRSRAQLETAGPAEAGG